jgi:hypothetical protein
MRTAALVALRTYINPDPIGAANFIDGALSDGSG